MKVADHLDPVNDSKKLVTNQHITDYDPNHVTVSRIN